MLLQTNSYVVPKEKRAEHARLLTRFRQTLARFGCDDFEVFEQSGSNWTTQETTGRYVQMIRFRDKKHHMEVQAAERTDPTAQKVIAEFCELINFPYQQQQGLFAVGFYTTVIKTAADRRIPSPRPQTSDLAKTTAPTIAGATAATAMAAAPADPATEILDEGIEEENGIAGRIGPDSTTEAVDAELDELTETEPTDIELDDLDLADEPATEVDVISEAEIEVDLDDAKQNEGTRR